MADFKELLRIKRAKEAEEKAKRKRPFRGSKEIPPQDISPAAQKIVDGAGVEGEDTTAFFKAVVKRLKGE